MQPTNIEIHDYLLKVITSCTTVKHIQLIEKFISNNLSKYNLPYWIREDINNKCDYKERELILEHTTKSSLTMVRKCKSLVELDYVSETLFRRYSFLIRVYPQLDTNIVFEAIRTKGKELNNDSDYQTYMRLKRKYDET